MISSSFTKVSPAEFQSGGFQISHRLLHTVADSMFTSRLHYNGFLSQCLRSVLSSVKHPFVADMLQKIFSEIIPRLNTQLYTVKKKKKIKKNGQ